MALEPIGEVLVICILVIRICLEFRYSNFEFSVTTKWVNCIK